MWDKLQKGGLNNTGTLYIIAIMATITSFAFVMMGGTFPTTPDENRTPPRKNPGKQEIIFDQVTDPGKKNLQLQTFSVKDACESRIAVDFLIDVSKSMSFGNKLSEEKKALKAFTDRMVDDSVIGMQIFSSPNNVREVVPISKYKDVKANVQNAINSLNPNGATSTRTAMILARDKLAQAVSSGDFANYKYSLILITDGVPEADGLLPYNSDKCIAVVPDPTLGERCFAKKEDPRIPSNIATEIKNFGVDIYSIQITSNSSSDRELQPHLEKLMKDIASTPINEHYYTSFEGTGLTSILDKVFTDICQ